MKNADGSEIIVTFNGLTCPLVISMVGLPARGKTSMANKVTRFLNWNGYDTKFFNISSYVIDSLKKLGRKNSAEFYHHENVGAQKLRHEAMLQVLEDVITWFKNSGIVAVIDGSQYSCERRRFLYEYIVQKYKYQLMFIESICDIPGIIEANILEFKIPNAHSIFEGDHDNAVREYFKRITYYEDFYVRLDKDDSRNNYSYIQIFNQGEKYIVSNSQGFLPSKVVAYLMNMRFQPRTIYITRHGESLYNLTGQIGGDSDLSDLGIEFAKKLGEFVVSEGIQDLEVWTSTLVRSHQTAGYINNTPVKRWKALNELYAGYCDGMTYKEFEEKYPEQFRHRSADKYNFRYPGCGESYNDLVHRLEGVIMELERHTNVMVISHQAVVRCLMAYYMNTTHDEIPYINIPLHTVIKLTPRPYNCDIEYIPLDTPSPVDTYRPKK